MKWHTPPGKQGQIVEVSYADSCDGTLWKRVVDRCDNTETQYRTDASDCGCDDECDCFEPWDREPTAFSWKEVANV